MKALRSWGMRLALAACCMFVLLPFSHARAAESIPVSLHVVNGEVRDVLTSLAALGNANIVTDDSVTGKITVNIDSLDLYAALDLVARAKGLQYHEENGVIVVGKKETFGQNFGDLHVFKLEYMDTLEAATAATLALGEEGIQSFDRKITEIGDNTKTRSTANQDKIEYKISKRLSIDRSTNSLLFYGTSSEAKIIENLLKTVDIPYQQIALEAKVVAISKDAAKNLGVEWEWSKLPQTPEVETEYETVTRTITDSNGEIKTITEQKPKTTITRKWKDGSEGIPGIISFGRGPDGYPFEFYYAAQLNALITNGKANILARPNIITLNGKEAVINIGDKVPVPTVSTTNSTTTTSIQYHDAGIILRYTPRINKDGYITADVHTEVSTPVYVADLKAYRFNTRSADTMVRLKDGETMVIGGLIGSEESKSISKVPFLGDLPILGRFFSNVKNSKTDSEVMIFLTARIVK